jgi:hypothetical protein
MCYARSFALFLLLIMAAYGAYSFVNKQRAVGQEVTPAISIADQIVLISWVNSIPRDVAACVQLAALSTVPGATEAAMVARSCGRIIGQEMAADAPPPQIAAIPAVQRLTLALQDVAEAYRTQDTQRLSTAAGEASAASRSLLRIAGSANAVLIVSM